MTKPLMSDAEIRRRKKIQGGVSRTTSTLGLGGLAVGGTALAARKPKVLGTLKKLPGMQNVDENKLKDIGLYTSLASGGIGSVGGYNFAAYTNAESRKRRPVVPKKPVKKNLDEFYTPYSGEEGIAKAYDPEEKRMARNKAYEGATLVGAGAGGAATAHQSLKLGNTIKGGVKTAQRGGGGKYHYVEAGGLKSMKSAGKKTALAAAVTGAAVAGNKKIREKQKHSWQPYVSKALGMPRMPGGLKPKTPFMPKTQTSMNTTGNGTVRSTTAQRGASMFLKPKVSTTTQVKGMKPMKTSTGGGLTTAGKIGAGGLAGAGAGGLYANRRNRVQKNMSPFGVVHD